MNTIIQTRLIKIGNSHGIRIPKVVLEQLKITNGIDLEIHNSYVILRPSNPPRANWAAAFKVMAEHGDDQLLDDDFMPTEWEETEWEW